MMPDRDPTADGQTPRRAIMAIIGAGGVIPDALDRLAAEVGARAMTAGLRIVTGGLGGVMAAASRGARSSPDWAEGRIIGLLPSYDRRTANPFVDIALPTGLQIGRNVLVVAAADVVVAVGGGAGTLSEMAIAWQLGRPLVALAGIDGWSARLAGEALDHRHTEPVARATSAAHALELALESIEAAHPEAGDIGSGWKR